MSSFLSFLKDVRVELAKVNWPTRSELTTYTMVVIGLSLVLAVFLGGVDFGLQYLLNAFVLSN